MVDNDFAKITYTEAVALLQKEIAERRVKFESYPNWGDDLGSEHERYLTEKVRAAQVVVAFFNHSELCGRSTDLPATHHRHQLPQGHQGLLHEAERRQRDRGGHGHPGAQDWRADRGIAEVLDRSTCDVQ